MDKKLYLIAVHGCDDSTRIEMQLTEEEFKLIEKVAEAITAASTYGCMPTMEVREAE